MMSPAPTELTILYEQGPCLVVLKPAGVLTQAPPGIDSMEVRIRRFLQQREGKQHNLYLGVPHRLDRPVSGALVVARHVRAARRLAEQFEQRTIDKRYWCLVERNVENERGTWVDYMRKIVDQPRSEIVSQSEPDAKEAILHYQVQSRRDRYTWLEIQLETGRTHQIRLQASHHGHPILGDAMYGSTSSFGPTSDDPREHWIALHARYLGFRDPMTKEPVEIEAPLIGQWLDEQLSSDY